ncbi:MAG: hypothetical protein ABJ275_11470 [Maricaulaceae bacterium]
MLNDYNLEHQEFHLSVNIERLLVLTSQIETNALDYKLNLAKFWNDNSHRIICTANGESTFPSQHFHNRIVLQSFASEALEKYFFSDPKGFPINPNVAVINQYGNYETILDYIDRLLSLPDAGKHYNTEQIKNSRDIIERDFNGKRYYELSVSERAGNR